MTSYPLHFPVGALMCPVEPMQVEDSLQLAANRLRDEGLPLLPVARGRTLVGALTNKSLTAAIGSGVEPLSAVEFSLEREVLTIAPYQTCAEALRLLGDRNVDGLVVVDDANQVLGVFSARDLIAPSDTESRPRLVGGMATPFGVYLTSGGIQAGAKGWALMATGATLITLFMAADIIAREILIAVHLRLFAINVSVQSVLLNVISTALFLLGLRLMPLSGIHAAEHMTVHAIERGEPLVPRIVGRMPRVHPRCGTNLAVALSVFLGISTANWFGDPLGQTLVALIVTASVWRPLGAAMQKYVTTKPPSDRHIQMGIRAGQELLDRYAANPMPTRNLFQRILNSGVLHLMAGSTAVTMLVEFLTSTFPALSFLKVYS